MSIRQLLRVAAALMAGAVAGCAAFSVVLAPSPVAIATDIPGGQYHPVGNAICRVYNLAGPYDEKPCVAVRSDGSVANIGRIKSGETTFGLSQTDLAYAAFHGEGPFAVAGPDPKLRTLISLYPVAFTIVARADAGIRDFRDLRGKRIGIGKSGAGYTFTRDVLLEYFNWIISEHERLLELGPAEQYRALCDDRVDAIIIAAGHPDGLTQEATTSCRAMLVRVAGPEIDRLLATHPYYIASVIPGGMYAGNPHDVPTFGTPALLITTSDQPDALAYAMVKAVFENFAVFRRLHPALSTLDMRDMAPSEAVMPIHPGAHRYYREAGLLRRQ
ncbi:MAG: TAXI family TRAP transporter solute-binding subunit [Alphaproteobacteria bacterium]